MPFPPGLVPIGRVSLPPGARAGGSALAGRCAGVQFIRSGYAEDALQLEQFVAVLARERIQHIASLRGQVHLHRAPVVAPHLALHQSKLFAREISDTTP